LGVLFLWATRQRYRRTELPPQPPGGAAPSKSMWVDKSEPMATGR